MAAQASQVDQLRIIHYPDPALRRKGQPVPAVDDGVRDVARRLIELMHEAGGVGLAAPQVALNWRVFVTSATGELDDDMVFINPRLSNPARQTIAREEGCLSIPHVNADITRPVAITIEALDLDGQPFTMTSEELPARVWQHECDHLDGVLIIDRMTPIDRRANLRALRELEGK